MDTITSTRANQPHEPPATKQKPAATNAQTANSIAPKLI